MKKILVVFLLFVSFNLFAQQKEIGRFNIELRDYDRADEIVYYEGTVQKPFTLSITSTFKNIYVDEYLSSWYQGSEIITRYYRYTKSTGRHQATWELFSYSFLREWSYQNRRSLETEAAQLARKMSEESGDKYTVQFFISDNEEYSWISLIPIKTDENGEKYYSFKAVFIFYVEAL